MAGEAWAEQFVLSREQRELGRQSELVRDVRHGLLVPVTRGAYRRVADVTATAATGAGGPGADDDRYLALLRATHLLAHGEIVFSALAAARVWGLPMVDAWPAGVSALVERSSGGRSTTRVQRSHVGHGAGVRWVDGLRVTSLARTVVDVGRTAPFEVAVAVADAALHGAAGRAPVEREQLWEELRRLGQAPGVAKCRAVVAFANGLAESPGESLSRVTMRRLGLPAPELQVVIGDERGEIGRVDFWWPRHRLVGEFDGVGKYLREELRDGRSPGEVVVGEKVREDRLRRRTSGVARWGWVEARTPSLLARRLAALR